MRECVKPSVYAPPLCELTPETSWGFECVDFLEGICGWTLLPWQKWLYIHALEKDRCGAGFRYDTVVVLIARQNGKSRWLLGLVLWRLFMDDARLVISAAQALAFSERFLATGVEEIERVPALRRRLESFCRTNGKNSVSLKRDGGGRSEWIVQVASRTGARSLTADLVVLDELREHRDWDAWDAFTATTTAVKRSQTVCASNAGDKQSVVLKELRDAARQRIAAGDTDNSSVGLFEWSAPSDADPFDESLWPLANPSLGELITVEKLRALSQRPNLNGFKTEHLCQWVEQLETGPFPEGTWEKCLDVDSGPSSDSPISVGIDVSVDRSTAYVATAYRRDDGLLGVELVARRDGTDWLADWLTAPERSWFDGRVALQARGAPVSSMIDELQDAGLTVVEWGGPELAKAFGKFYDRVKSGSIRHRADPALDAAVSCAATHFVADTWVIDRKKSAQDAAPLIACIAAAWLANVPQVEYVPSAYDDLPGGDDISIFV